MVVKCLGCLHATDARELSGYLGGKKALELGIDVAFRSALALGRVDMFDNALGPSFYA